MGSFFNDIGDFFGSKFFDYIDFLGDYPVVDPGGAAATSHYRDRDRPSGPGYLAASSDPKDLPPPGSPEQRPVAGLLGPEQGQSFALPTLLTPPVMPSQTPSGASARDAKRKAMAQQLQRKGSRASTILTGDTLGPAGR